MVYIREQYLSWPDKLRESYLNSLTQVEKPLVTVGKRLIVGCGMGGSGFTLYAVEPLINDTPYIIVRSNLLPSYVSSEDIVVGVSYSGETYETISCIQQAIKRNAIVAGVAGKDSTLVNLLKPYGKYVEIVKEGFPRSSLATLVGALLALIYGEEVREEVEKASRLLEVDGALNYSNELAERLYNEGDPYTPILVSCGQLGFVAERWLTEFAENTKHPALLEIYPEAAHNRIARWTHTRGYYYTIYIDVGGDELCKLTKDYVVNEYEKLGLVEVIDLSEIANKSKLAAVLYSSMLAGLTSVKLAELLHRDPERIEGIDNYKRSVTKRLKSRLGAK
ncbi:MAG: hypothetical protein F7B78_04295 [Desulfurococcales archaeon]|nr:hypothetical protein [Desulfurococcales archaeon]